MVDANDLASALKFISNQAETPEVAVHMVAAMIDGVAEWTVLTPLNVTMNDGSDLTQVEGWTVHLHDMI